ncbi:hypothetical protein FQA39_LY05396 [Lamprigera yunnana]|nr:hypothetical protein FQA39_LY05396 [Lamprigera yunnana]
MCNEYKVPEPEILVYYPQGFSVSIPNARGMRLFTFHANFNKRITLGGTGEYYKQVVHNSDGKWFFVDDKKALKIGDTISYWVTVVKDHASYKRIANYTVKDLLPLTVNLKDFGCFCNYNALESQIEILSKKNILLCKVLEKLPNSKKLTLSGRLPPNDNAAITVSFVLWEKLSMSPRIKSAVKNEDGSITFEVLNLEDKMLILSVAQEQLRNSKYVID